MLIAPAILFVMVVTIVTTGIMRPLIISLFFSMLALAVGRVALRSATFEKLLS